MSVILGIDPGLSGGVAWIGPDGPQARPMPLVGKLIHVHGFVELLREARPGLVVIERAEARPGQSATALGTTFENYGLLRGVVEGRFLPLEIVRPTRWKKAMGLTSDKAESIGLCQRLFPTVDLKATPRSRNDSDGMAEALLLAEWARRHVVLPADEREVAE